MTEGEMAFYKRRYREELRLSSAAKDRQIEKIHLSWAQFFNDRLNGMKKSLPPQEPRHYCHKMEDYYYKKIEEVEAPRAS